MWANWGHPVDAASWLALGLAVALLLVRRGSFQALLTRPTPLVFAASVSCAAFMLSMVYVYGYLDGAPRIIDATTYYLSAKLAAVGRFSFAPDGPLAAFNGRFLVTSPDGQLGPLFPPGYPSVLALGVLLGKPMWVGPLLAAAIASLTYHLGVRWFQSESVARLAAVFSVLSAALRYHTADTMSHGLAALLLLTGVYTSTYGSLTRRLLGGLAIGWLCATRPVTGLFGLCAVLALTCSQHRGSVLACLSPSQSAQPHGARLGRQALVFALGMVPGLLLLGLQQRAMTGSWFGSLQYTYYSRADYPSGCFRYGFGAQIGCRFEHGDFVEQFMPTGYGLIEAAKTTARRLAAHLCDPANIEVLCLMLPVWAWIGRSTQQVRWLCWLVLGQMLAYAPFYYDGNYPGGGARIYAEILPFEHILLAWGLCRWKLPHVGLVLSLLGFSCHAVHRHTELSTRDGGLPMFEPRVLAAHGVTRGLVFVDTDHGFNLGFEPKPDPQHDITVARYRGDGTDALLYQRLGAPASYHYLFDRSGQTAPRLEAYTPRAPFHFQAASLWPPRTTVGGASFPTGTRCEAGTTGLALVPDADAFTAEVDLWLPKRALYAFSALAEGPLQLPGMPGVNSQQEGACVRTTAPAAEMGPGVVSVQIGTAQRLNLASVDLLEVTAAR